MTTDNKNNASQTLFRFVSLRNPQLTETKDKNLGFIHRKDKLTGIFDNAVKPQLTNTALVKFGLMEREAKTFALLAFKKESEIENDTALNEILRLGRKMAKKEPLSADDETAAVAAFQEADDDMVSKLWNNLIFQVLTQQDFYVKEAVTQMLKALHFGYVCTLQPSDELKKINGPDLKAKARDAKIVLPASLFCDGNTGNTSANGSFQVDSSPVGKGMIGANELPAPVQHLLKMEGEKIAELSLLEVEKKALSTLKSELEDMQKTFYKLRTKAYEKAYREYKTHYQPAIDARNEAIERIEDQITSTMTQQEIDKLYASLDEFNIPAFTFDYKNELNFEDLSSQLSGDSFAYFVEHFTLINNGRPYPALNFSQLEMISDKEMLISKIPVSITDEYDTFEEVYEVLNQKITTGIETLLSKSPVTEQEFSRIGSVLVPVSRTTYSEISGTYFLKLQTTMIASVPKHSVSFYYNTDSTALGLLSATLEMASNNDNYLENIPSIDVVDGKVIFPVVESSIRAVSSVKVILYFKNGESAVVLYHDMVAGKVYTGRFSFRIETEEPEEGGGNPDQGTTVSSGTFTPKHFGVKRLGIADYLKVEQSVHAYVPGEVSNIENVMASELRHKSSVSRDYSETIDTTSESVETEKISDTTKTERNEMQTEVAKEIEKQQSFEASTRARGKAWGWTMEVAAGYANTTAQHDSTRQAVAKSQEITERAMERVLTKINKERVQKIIREYTETNVHEFDNRGKVTDTNNPDAARPKHITGVYRWVDKKMKNQIYNYGKRTMFEFMIPEPAKLHRLATFASKETVKEPVDPRKAVSNKMENAKTTEELIRYWAEIYRVELTALPERNITVKQAQIYEKPNSRDNSGPYTRLMQIPQNYIGKSGYVDFVLVRESRFHNSEAYSTNFMGGDFNMNFGNASSTGRRTFSGANINNNAVFSFRGRNLESCEYNIIMNCELSNDFMQTWKQENFDAIITAYEAAYAEFLIRQKEAEEKAKTEQAGNEEKIGNFYREMESVILKHNCIAYLLQDYLGILGKKFTNGTEMKDFSITLSNDLDQYTALAKFMEQAFEWSIMDYTFYPYYWASRDEWQKMYLSESADPLFRNFLQAGMARVIVTVNPGFEDAVQFFMSTGRIWNDGDVPVIGDPLYMSMADELRQPTGQPQGKYWITRIPTTLTILQAGSAGLIVDHALPIFPEDHPENCENPKDLEESSAFGKPEDIHMIGGGVTTSTLD